MDPLLRAAAAHVVVVSLDAPVLDDDDTHHLARVLRLRSGAAVTATDGAGRWRSCRWSADGLAADGPVAVADRRPPPLTIGFAPVKGDRPEWVVQKLTELGVDRIVVLRAARSVVRWDGPREAVALDRLRRVAREAVMQSRGCWLPSVDGVVAPASVAGAALADPAGSPVSLTRPVVLVGPEGGWTPEELTAAAATVSLGPLILRAETAAVTAGALLAALRDGLVNT